VSPALERQRWLGALALAVAVPLPLTGIVSLPFLLPFVAAGLAALLARRPLAPFPLWLENLLAPLILVIVVLAGGMRYGVLRPVAQLAVLLAAVRIPGCGLRGRAASATGMVALIGVAGVASSTHPALALYLVGLLALVVVAAGRLQILGLVESTHSDAVGDYPPPRMVGATIVVALVVSAPLFVLLPRLRSPFAASPFGSRPVSGFREAIALHRLGDVKLSRALALKVRFPGGETPSPEWLRLAGGTVQAYRAGSWAEEHRNSRLLRMGVTRTVGLGEEEPAGKLRRVEITLEKETDRLFLPLGAVRLEPPPGVPVWRGHLGTLHIPRGTDPPVDYTAEFDPSLVNQPPPEPEDLRLSAGARAIRELAIRVTRGAGGPLARALDLESYLRTTYHYTTSTYAPIREDPVEWFLFRSRQGHCEFFASSMVMLLRSLGIPARLQAGYAGGEPDGDGNFWVRESDAHAWVVAWIGDHWRLFDPTPAEGRPGLLAESLGWRLRWDWQRLEQKWDRWVLTFSLADQLEIARRGWRAFTTLRSVLLPALALLLAGVAGAVLLAPLLRRVAGWRPRHRGGVSGALRRVMRAAGDRGVEVDSGLTPRGLGEVLAPVLSDADGELRWLIEAHERHCYAGGDAPSRRELGRVSRRIIGRLRALPRAVGPPPRAPGRARGWRPPAGPRRSRRPGSGRSAGPSP
jgi:transglutaminase-like putative cysteine protease